MTKHFHPYKDFFLLKTLVFVYESFFILNKFVYLTTAKTKTTQHLSFALGGQLRGVYFHANTIGLFNL